MKRIAIVGGVRLCQVDKGVIIAKSSQNSTKFHRDGAPADRIEVHSAPKEHWRWDHGLFRRGCPFSLGYYVQTIFQLGKKHTVQLKRDLDFSWFVIKLT
jgi:hypothetical protein